MKSHTPNKNSDGGPAVSPQGRGCGTYRGPSNESDTPSASFLKKANKVMPGDEVWIPNRGWVKITTIRHRTVEGSRIVYLQGENETLVVKGPMLMGVRNE